MTGSTIKLVKSSLEPKALDMLQPLFSSDKAKLDALCTAISQHLNFFVIEDFEMLKQLRPDLQAEFDQILSVCKLNQGARFDVLVEIYRQLGLTKYELNDEKLDTIMTAIEGHGISAYAQNCLPLLVYTESLDMAIEVLKCGAYKYERNATNDFLELRFNEQMTKMSEKMSPNDREKRWRLINGCVILILGNKMFELEHINKLRNCLEAVKQALTLFEKRKNSAWKRKLIVIVALTAAILSWIYIFFMPTFCNFI